MAELRILNDNPDRLRSLLGNLAWSLDLKGGDTCLQLTTEEQVAVGRAVFEQLLTAGYYSAFAHDPVTHKTKYRMTEFDPSEELVVMFGPVAGG